MRQAMWAVLVLAACHGVGSTGSRGIRGELRDADGSPIPRQRIVSEDHGDRTEPDGSFEVRWKDPTTFVDFKRGGVTWRRVWQPERDSGTVVIELPAVREGEIVCRTDLECMAEVTWPFEDGLRASLSLQCGEKTPASVVPGMPPGLPRVRCSTIMGELDLDVSTDQGRLTIRSRAQPAPLRITGVEDPEACDVEILHGQVIQGVGERGLRVDRESFAWSICEGRAGPAVAVVPRGRNETASEATIELPAATSGVDLRLDPPLEQAPRILTLVRRNVDGSIDWEQRIEPDALGVYRMPPLARGEYRLGWGAPQVFATLNPPVPEIPGTVVIAARGGVWGEEGGYVGALRLEEDTPEGTIEVDGHPPERVAPPEASGSDGG